MNTTRPSVRVAYSRLIPDTVFKHKSIRNVTFQKHFGGKRFTWPKSFISTEELAESGFYCLRDQDTVQCAFCHLVLTEFKSGNIPSEEHRKYSPSCKYLNGLEKDQDIIRLQQVNAKVCIAAKEITDEAQKQVNAVKEQTQMEIKELKNKVHELQVRNMCKVCHCTELKILFIPCGHMCTCEDCSNTVFGCPICRAKIYGKINVFY